MLDDTVDVTDADITTDDGAGEPDAPVARADAPDEPAPSPAPNWDDPQLQERIAQVSQQSNLELLERLGLLSYEQPAGPTLPSPELAFENPEQYNAEVEAYLEAKLAAQNAPVQEYFAAQQAAQTDAVIGGAITEAATAAKLEGTDPSVLRALAAQFATLPEYARYGATIEGVKATAKAAADFLAARDKAAEERGITRYRTQIGEIQDTPAEPSAGGSGGLSIESKPKTYDEIIAKYAV
jgi:hypothetical protein